MLVAGVVECVDLLCCWCFSFNVRWIVAVFGCYGGLWLSVGFVLCVLCVWGGGGGGGGGGGCCLDRPAPTAQKNPSKRKILTKN